MRPARTARRLAALATLLMACGHAAPAPEPAPDPVPPPTVTTPAAPPEAPTTQAAPAPAPPDVDPEVCRADWQGDPAFKFQEAIWELQKAPATAKTTAQIRCLEARLRQIFSDGPVAGGVAPLGGGISQTFLVTFGHGVKGVFKKNKPNPETWNGTADLEVAVYRVDQLLGFGLTPMTLTYTLEIAGAPEVGSLMYFVAGAKKPTYAQMTDELRLFDWIIGNYDRHTGNFLVRANGDLVALDHDAAFDINNRFVSAHGVAGGRYVARLQAVTRATWMATLEAYVTPFKIARLIERVQRALAQDGDGA